MHTHSATEGPGLWLGLGFYTLGKQILLKWLSRKENPWKAGQCYWKTSVIHKQKFMMITS